jgi:hypothetical protein
VKRVILDGVHTNEDETTVDDKRKHFIPPKERGKRVQSARVEFMNDHFNLGLKNCSAVPKNTGISTFNPTRIFRTRDWQVLQKPEQKFYSFCFDKRIVLSDFDTVPYGYVGPLG